MVLQYIDGMNRPDSQDERYSGRAEFFTEEIPKGNFSIKLRKVRLEDKGEFRCEVHSDTDSANTTARIAALGYSSLHWLILMLCITVTPVVLLTGALSVWHFIQENKGRQALLSHWSLVTVPSVMVSSAFILWGVTEGFTEEAVTCTVLSLLSILMLFIMDPKQSCPGICLGGDQKIMRHQTEKHRMSKSSMCTKLQTQSKREAQGLLWRIRPLLWTIISTTIIIVLFTVPIIGFSTKNSITTTGKVTLGVVVGGFVVQMVFMASVQFLYFRIGDKYVHICKELKESLKKTLWAIFAFVIIMVLFAIGVVIFLAKYYSGNATIGEIAQIGTFLTVFTVLMIAFLTPVIRFCILMIRHIRTEIGFYRFFRLFNSQNMMFNMQILTLYIQLKAWMQGTILLGYFIPMTVTYLGICVCFIAKRFLCLFRHFYLAQKILLGILFSLHLILSLLYLSLVLDNDKERPVKICEFVFIYILIVTNNGDWYRDKHLAKPRKYVRFSGALGLPLLNSAALAVALKLKADTGKQPLDLRLIVLISGSVFLFGWFVIQMSAYWLDKEEKIKEAFTQIKDPDPDQVLSTDPEMCELIQERLDRLLHAQQCQWEKQDLVFHQFWRCSKPHCCTMRKVLKHMANCKNSTSCQVKHCASSRRIMSKWEEGYIWSYKPKLIQEQLELLQHADRCQCKKQEFSQWSCSRPHCATMGKVLKHIKEDCNCQAGTSCQVKHCASSRRIISENKGYVWSYIATEESSTEV